MAAATLALSPRYRGTELIATGGMADVYVATDVSLERLVAIKVLSERFAGDPEIRSRFSREARIAARLSTEPNVITIFGVEDVNGRPAIMMEFLPGGTLADRMSAARIPPALALAWLEQAGRALDAAHVAGVVHRDVKPANLMLGGDGEVRVTDFGIARIAGDASLTSVGTILGTSGYMSPEQAVGGTATTASDRYGLAVVAFELLCGRRPYLADSFAAEAAAHATAPIPAATRFDHSLPPSIDAVFERGLAKDPEQRFRSCGELVASLRWAFAESAATTVRIAPPVVATGTTVQRAKRDIPRALVVLAALVALTLVGLLTAGLMDRGSEAAPPTTVVRTATVAGKPVVRTVTVEAQQQASAQDPAAEYALAGPGRHGRRGAQRSGIQVAQGRQCRCRAAAARACGQRAAGLGLGDRGLRALQPRGRPLLDRRLHRRRGSAAPVGAHPGEAPRDQAARARRRQGLRATDSSGQ